MKATAFIVGPADGPGAALVDMAKSLRFQSVLPYTGIARAEQQAMRTPVIFFLFAAIDQVESLRGTAEAIRFAPSRRIRFSPMIYFSESPAVETIRACINMGFDDIITLPFTQGRLADRLGRQVGTNLIYFETADYFGPDRRGRVSAGASDNALRNGGKFRRIEVVRNFTTGTNVVRDELQTA